jgi:hypothetical protein
LVSGTKIVVRELAVVMAIVTTVTVSRGSAQSVMPTLDLRVMAFVTTAITAEHLPPAGQSRDD